MNDYSMSDDVFRQRALEEDGCVVTAIGAGLVKALNFDGVSVSLNEDQRRFIQGKIQEGRFQSANDLFQEALRVFESHDALKTVELRDLRARISDSIASFEQVEQVDGREFVEGVWLPEANQVIPKPSGT
jgi:antitoxin ParD1/3/4